MSTGLFTHTCKNNPSNSDKLPHVDIEIKLSFMCFRVWGKAQYQMNSQSRETQNMGKLHDPGIQDCVVRGMLTQHRGH
jgi:hypothetical protein